MTATRTAQTRVASTPALLSPTSLLLAAAVALEIVGARALGPAAVAPSSSVVASIDGVAAEAPIAPVHRLRAASVEVRVLAQADVPAH